MSQHRSLKGASTISAKRNVLKRFERVELEEARPMKQGAIVDLACPRQSRTRKVCVSIVISPRPELVAASTLRRSHREWPRH